MTFREQNSTAYPIMFLMIDAGDHITGLAGLAPVVTLSKNGGAFNPAAGAVSEIGDGWYALAGAAADRSTVGDVVLHATAPGADPLDLVYTVADWDPFDGTSIAEAVWQYNGVNGRTLSGGAPMVQQNLLNGDVFLRRGDTITVPVTALGPLLNRAKLWFTVKADVDALDTQAILQVEETVGLIYLNGAPGAAGDASIVVNDANLGNITITIKPAASKALPTTGRFYFDIQMSSLAGDVFTLMSGRAPIVSDITRAIS